MHPLVSILIPAYNAEAWISDTLESALGQTWPRKEIIVVDDSSTDDTLTIVRRFASKSVSVVSKPNEGASSARNKAFSLSQGDYIQWLDADDLLAPDKIERQMTALNESGDPRTLFSSAWGRFIYRPERAEFTPTSLWHDLTPAEWLLRKLADNVFMQTGVWLVSRELSEAAGEWDTRLSGDDDGEYFCRVILASNGIRFVPEAKMFYRRSGIASLSYIGASDEKLEAQFLSMQLHIRYLRSLEESDRVRAACLTFLQDWLIQFYPERPDLVNQIEQLAVNLGGQLRAPKLSWKYAWIQKLFGWKTAKQAQCYYNRHKSSLRISLDKALSCLEKRKPADYATSHATAMRRP
jgi:glycosyltransferase involved in cell wall biosynthesis